METINNKDLSKYELPELEKRSHQPSLIGGICLAVVGVVLLYVQTLCPVVGLAYLLILLGIAFAVHGVYLIFRGSRCWFYKPTKTKVAQKEYFYAADDFNALKSAVEHRHIDGLKEIKRLTDGNVKMVVVSTKEGNFAAAQVFRYQPFEFKPETDIVVMTDAEAAAFLGLFGKH